MVKSRFHRQDMLEQVLLHDIVGQCSALTVDPKCDFSILGPFKCYVTLFSSKFDPLPPPPHNANKV